MLTPQEVSDKKFKQAFVGGYDMGGVDDFLETLTVDYATLYKENATLKGKMKVLLEKLEEYRKNEDSVRTAYVAIHEKAQTELEEAKNERAKIVADANREIEDKISSIATDIFKEEKRLKLAHEQTVSFVNALKELYTKQMEQLDHIPSLEMIESVKYKREAQLNSATHDIAHSIASSTEYDSLPSGKSAEAPKQPAPKPPAIHQAAPRPVQTMASVPDQRPAPAPKPSIMQEVKQASYAPPSADNDDYDHEGQRNLEKTKIISQEEIMARLQEKGIGGLTSAGTPAVSEPEKKPRAIETSVNDAYTSLEQKFNFSDENDDHIWDPEEITEVKQPTYDFQSLEGNFGHKK